MNNISKIINRLTSRKGVYDTPHLNFKYEPVVSQSPDDNGDQSKMETLEKYIKREEELIQNLLEEKGDLNKKALTEILSGEENKRLAGIFTKINKHERKVQRLKDTTNKLHKESPESFFNK